MRQRNWGISPPDAALVAEQQREADLLFRHGMQTRQIDIHDALLPDYAGFGSVNWSIRNGETKIGLTVHVMERELDTGPILHTVTVPIGPLDTATTVTGELLNNYPDAVLTALDLIAQGAHLEHA